MSLTKTKDEVLAVLKEYTVGMPDSEGGEVYAIHETDLEEIAEKLYSQPNGIPKVKDSGEVACEKPKIVNHLLKDAALPLIKYLSETHHPHTMAIVTNTGVEVMEGVLSVQDVADFIKD